LPSVWCLRRVLLAGENSGMLHAMRSQLCALGARPQSASNPVTAESLDRTLHEGRFSCVIVPDLLQLCSGDAQARFAALDMILQEAREAGVPLVMLLAGQSSLHADEIAVLFSHALGCACGAFGDPVSVQCIQHANQDPEVVCLRVLRSGSRFLAGDTSCTGYFSLQG